MLDKNPNFFPHLLHTFAMWSDREIYHEKISFYFSNIEPGNLSFAFELTNTIF